MSCYLILCQNPALATSLQVLLIQKGLATDEQIASKAVGDKPMPKDIANFFEALADWVESTIQRDMGKECPIEIMALTDLCGYESVSPYQMNPVRNQGWATILGMLIFGFPEIHWVLVSGKKWSEETKDEKTYQRTNIEEIFAEQLNGQLAEFIDVHNNGLSPLFDAIGLRNAIPRTNSDDKVNKSTYRRRTLAIAIDDEKSYAWLHAYTAYRFGFRAQAVTTDAGMKVSLKDHYPHPTLVFEDYFLQFGDVHPDGFSKLRVRDTYEEGFGRLGEAGFRILVTSGHHHGQDKEASEDNPRYLRELRTKGQWNKELYKPLGGIFNLWNDSGLQRKLRDGGRRGLAPGYDWPPKQKKLDDDKGGHSAPGRLLVIADRLIARSERLLSTNGVHSVPQAVHGAVLATDALELLGGKTPTTSLEALALKHQFEVLAECQFVGMQQHMDIEGRMKDIQLEIEAICYWFGTKRRQKEIAKWNAELSILNKLITVFRDNNQFDEEQTLLVRTRVLHRKLRFAKYPLIFRPLEIFPWYVERLVTSFPLFLMAIFAWILALGTLYDISAIDSSFTWNQGLADAFIAFIGLSPPGDDQFWQAAYGWNSAFWLVAVTMGLGFIHLGIFISHLYSIISRK